MQPRLYGGVFLWQGKQADMLIEFPYQFPYGFEITGRKICKSLKYLVGDTGIEPVTPAV